MLSAFGRTCDQQNGEQPFQKFYSAPTPQSLITATNTPPLAPSQEKYFYGFLSDLYNNNQKVISCGNDFAVYCKFEAFLTSLKNINL